MEDTRWARLDKALEDELGKAQVAEHKKAMMLGYTAKTGTGDDKRNGYLMKVSYPAARKAACFSTSKRRSAAISDSPPVPAPRLSYGSAANSRIAPPIPQCCTMS